MRGISRRVRGRVHPEVFLIAKSLQREESLCQHHQSDMMMPSCPVPPFVVIQPQLFLELLIILSYLPASFCQTNQPPERVGLGQIAEKIFCRFFLLLEPSLAAFTPANLLPAFRLERDLAYIGRLLAPIRKARRRLSSAAVSRNSDLGRLRPHTNWLGDTHYIRKTAALQCVPEYCLSTPTECSPCQSLT